MIALADMKTAGEAMKQEDCGSVDVKVSPSAPTSPPDSCATTSTIAVEEREPEAKKTKLETSFFDSFFSGVIATKVQEAKTPMEKAKDELKLYLTLPVNGSHSEFSQLS